MKKKSLMTKVAILFSGAGFNINIIVFSVAIGAIAANFPGVTSVQMSQIINMPALFMIPALYISAQLAKVISKKYVLILGWGLFIFSGFSYTFCTTITQLLVVRAITGFAVGLMSSVPKALVAQLYPGEISQLNGIQQSCVTSVSLICSIAAGALSALSWKHPIYLFYLGCIFLLLIIFFVPAVPPEKKEFAQTERRKVTYGKRKISLMAAGSFFFMLFCILQTKSTLLIIQSGLGDSVMAGNVKAVMTFGSVVGGFVFAYIMKRSKKATILISLFLAAMGYFLISTTSSLIIMFIANFIVGMTTLGMIIPWYIARLSQETDKAQVTMVLTTYTIINYISQFVATYFTSLIEHIAGNDAPATALFGVAVFLSIGFIVAAAMYLLPVKNKKELN